MIKRGRGKAIEVFKYMVEGTHEFFLGIVRYR